MRRLVTILVALVVGLGLADFGFRAWAEGRFAADVQAGLGLPEKPDLSLSGFPFALAMARGRLNEATIEAEGLTNDGLRVQRFEVRLEDVRFKAGEIFSSGAGTITAATGDGEAEVTSEDMTAYLMMKGYPGRISFGDGVATVDTEIIGIPITATGPLSIVGTSLVFEPDEVDAGGTPFPVEDVAFSFELQVPFEGFAYSDIVVTEGVATLKARVQNGRIVIEPAPAE